MRKLLILIILAISTFSLSANTLSLRVEKETNGGYLLSVPHLELENRRDLFIHRLNLDLLFTSPRENFERPNHYAVLCKNALGVQYKSVYLTFSLDIKYVFFENDYNETEGLKCGNTLELGIKF